MTKTTIQTALTKASGLKFTLQDKKLVIDAIKVRYNSILNAVNQGLQAALRKESVPNFPIQVGEFYIANFKATLNATQRAAFDKVIKDVESLQKQHQKLQEARTRVIQGYQHKADEMRSTLTAERDELILQVSLLGSSEAANAIIAALRNPKDIEAEMQREGIAVSIEAMQISGIGHPTPKQIG